MQRRSPQAVVDAVRARHYPKMRCGWRVKVTAHEHTMSLAKSALQKAIRRGQTKYACEVAMDVWMYTTMKDNDGQSCVTNMVNRLNLILAEDVGMASPYLYVALRPQFDKLNQEKHDGKRSFVRGTLAWLRALLDVVTGLCEAPHSRLVSMVGSLYFNDNRTEFSRKHYPEFFANARMAGTSTTFEAALKAGSYMAVYYASLLNSVVVWDVLVDLAGHSHRDRVMVDFLLERYKPHVKEAQLKEAKFGQGPGRIGEKHIYLIQAILVVLFMYRNEYPAQVDLNPQVVHHTARQAADMLEHAMDHKWTPTYESIDMHTTAGRTKSRGLRKTTVAGISHFLQHGAIMYREVKFENDARMREAYARYKFHCEGLPYTPVPIFQNMHTLANLPANWLARTGKSVAPVAATNSNNNAIVFLPRKRVRRVLEDNNAIPVSNHNEVPVAANNNNNNAIVFLPRNRVRRVLEDSNSNNNAIVSLPRRRRVLENSD